MTLFKDDKGEVSWRKIITAIAAICFATAQIGYLVTHNFEPLPVPYWSIDAGIMVFYFNKRIFEGMKLTQK